MIWNSAADYRDHCYMGWRPIEAVLYVHVDYVRLFSVETLKSKVAPFALKQIFPAILTLTSSGPLWTRIRCDLGLFSGEVDGELRWNAFKVQYA